MVLNLKPFDAADYLINDEEIAAFLEDALASGDAGVFASALSAAARAKGRLELADGSNLSRFDFDERSPSTLPFQAVLEVLRRFGLSLHLVPASMG